MIVPSFVKTNPISWLVVPSCTNVNAPFSISLSSLKSDARVGAPVAFTVYIPFSVPVVWSFIKILSPVARVIPSIVWLAAKAEFKLPSVVVATLTASLTCKPCATLSTYDLVTALLFDKLESFEGFNTKCPLES